MSLLRLEHFWKMGGNCPYSILTIFGKWEEIVPTPFWPFLKNGRKLSLLQSYHFSEMGGNCPSSILTIFQKWEEIVPTPFWPYLENGRKLSKGHFDHFSEMGGNCADSILTIFRKWEEIVPTPFWPYIGNWRKLSLHLSFFYEMGGNSPILCATLFLECLFWLDSWEEEVLRRKIWWDDLFPGESNEGKISYQESFAPRRKISWRIYSWDNFLLGRLSARRINFWDD